MEGSRNAFFLKAWECFSIQNQYKFLLLSTQIGQLFDHLYSYLLLFYKHAYKFINLVLLLDNSATSEGYVSRRYFYICGMSAGKCHVFTLPLSVEQQVGHGEVEKRIFPQCVGMFFNTISIQKCCS